MYPIDLFAKNENGFYAAEYGDKIAKQSRSAAAEFGDRNIPDEEGDHRSGDAQVENYRNTGPRDRETSTLLPFPGIERDQQNGADEKNRKQETKRVHALRFSLDERIID